MISSAAVTAVPARDHIGAAAEGYTPNSSKPRPVLKTPDGASRTATHLNALKEANPYGSQGTGPRHENHDDHPARREDHHDHPRRQPVTAVPVEAPVIDMGAVENDIAAVLAAHGILAHGMRVNAHLVVQGDAPIGVTVQAFGRPTTTRPHSRDDDVFDAIVAPLKEAS